jgi:hypothetical protein
VERVTTIDEQPATGNQSAAEPRKRKRTSLADAAVERTNPNGKRRVVTLLSGFELKFLDCHVAWRQPSAEITAAADSVSSAIALAERATAST